MIRARLALLVISSVALASSSARADDAPAAEAQAEGIVTLHVDAPVPVILERRRGNRSAWEQVCEAPCDQRLSLRDDYRLIGAGLMASPPFMLDPTDGGKLTIVARPAHHWRYVAAVWLLAGGVVVGVAGAIMVIADGGFGSGDHTAWITVGVATIIAGGTSAVLGGAIALQNAHTSVGGAVAREPEASAARPGSTVAGAPRPAWYEATRRTEAPIAPAALVIPLIRGTF